MKKTTRKKSHSATRSKIAVAATILAIPLLSLPGTGFAEGDHIYLKIRSTDKFSIAGSSGGHTVYKNTEGKFFYLDPHGDMKFISVYPPVWKIGSELKKAPTTSNAAANLQIKMTDAIVSSYSNVARDHKHGNEVSILGVDAKGNTVNENSRGEKFYLDAITGDMIFVDGKGLTAFRNPAPDSSAAPGIVAHSPTGSNLPTSGDVTGDGRRVAAAVRHEDPNSAIGSETTIRGTARPPSKEGDGKPGITGGPYLTIELKEVLVSSSKIAENNSPSPTNRGVIVGNSQQVERLVDTQKPGIRDQGAAGGLISYATALPPKGGDKELPSLALEGSNIPGVDVKLGKNPPGGIVASSKTDVNGVFHFDKLPAGNYELKVPGLPDQLLTVGADGIAGGKLMKGSDGSLSIFDRWGNRTAASPKDEGIKAAGTPFGFGSGNTPGAGPGMSAGPGMGPGMSPGAGSAMGGPMSPGPSPMGGGPGGPGAGMRR